MNVSTALKKLMIIRIIIYTYIFSESCIFVRGIKNEATSLRFSFFGSLAFQSSGGKNVQNSLKPSNVFRKLRDIVLH